ncbi:uncharacterized protein LOC123450331 [Hordeum vulgare subsp. vulgare]|uniref:Uncharacterized protein n=1 Tax=Hordeum vulgare subsp. vulgare TaxID=112509 RepID=M0UQM1_HORVV|nr:uncharacterized protein LOC123450331 [Hordeum vulgare subsp. vulgare]
MALAWLEDCVDWLSVYVYRIVLLLSLLMYLILDVFSESRRREGKGWKRGLFWLAYQLTDWVPAYVISNLYLETSPREKMIIAFWVPFLLLHNARPDNISAYTIEDNELWLRLFVFVPLQSLGSVLIVYRYILADCTTGLLRQASFIMLLLGLFKYVESAAALWLCNLSRIRRSFRKLQPIASSFRRDYGGSRNLKDEEALLVAHGLFDICKGAFSDYSVEYMDRDAVRSLFSGKWESMCKVVEMELSLMYDILYTKAAMVYTWHGYVIRLASPPLTATALFLFSLQCKDGMRTEDKVISYVLLGTTFLLDLRWLLRALASTWTYSFFKGPHSWLNHQVLCRKRWHKLRRCVLSLSLSRLSLWLWTRDCAKKHKSYRRWEGTFGRRNLLEQCSGGERNNLYSISRMELESKDHSRGLEIPDYVKKLVFNVICAELFPAPLTPMGNQQRSSSSGDENPGPPRSPSSSSLLKNGQKGSRGRGNPDDHDSSSKHGQKGSRGQGNSNDHDSSSKHGQKGSRGQGNSNDHDITSRDEHQKSPQPQSPKCPCEWPWKPPICTVHLPHANQHNCIDTDKPPRTPVSREPVCSCMDNLPPPWPFYLRESICNDMDSEPPLWPFYRKEWISNGMDNEPPSWTPYTWEQMCNGMDNEPPPLSPHTRQRICNGRLNEPPPWPPYPRQVCDHMSNAPFDQERDNAPAWPHHCLDEEVAKALPGPYKQHTDGHWMYDQAPPEPYEPCLWRNARAGPMYGQFTLDNPNMEAAALNPTDESGKDTRFPPELQETILIWHIATDVFLSWNHTVVPAALQDHGKAIKAMSDYMVFLLAKRPSMLPGLKLRSLYEKARATLREVGKIKEKGKPTNHTTTKEKAAKELATWMLENVDHLKDPSSAIWEGKMKDHLKDPNCEGKMKDHLKDPSSAIWEDHLKDPNSVICEGKKKDLKDPSSAIWEGGKKDNLKDANSAIWEGKKKDHLKGLATLWEGTQIAQVLLSQIQDGKHDQRETMAEECVWKLAYWIPGLLEPHQDLEGMLKFILEAWVHLLMYASIRGSREAHAKQLSRGGGLTTLVWIISEHAEDRFVRSKCPSFFL